jgi:hypothetical protein
MRLPDECQAFMLLLHGIGTRFVQDCPTRRRRDAGPIA